MAVTAYSELSYYRGLSLIEPGRSEEAQALFKDLMAFAGRKLAAEAKIDYFATSLPLLLVFEADLNQCKRKNAEHLIALAKNGLRKILEKE
jgi:hypothetical protein